MHLGKKDYACRICDRKFAHVSNLNRHKLSHEKDRPFVCQIKNCGQRYKQIATLNQHLKKHDPPDVNQKHRKNKVFHCIFCEEKFVHKADLDLHKIKHAKNPYPYSCKKCKKGTFTNFT